MKIHTTETFRGLWSIAFRSVFGSKTIPCNTPDFASENIPFHLTVKSRWYSIYIFLFNKNSLSDISLIKTVISKARIPLHSLFQELRHMTKILLLSSFLLDSFHSTVSWMLAKAVFHSPRDFIGNTWTSSNDAGIAFASSYQQH